jgi:hypothetical protein
MITRSRYLRWMRSERNRRGDRCESCGFTAKALGQVRLHLHHLMSVRVLGLADPSVVDSGNVMLLCNCCHCLFHPGQRVYPWNIAGKQRGMRLA